MSAGKNAIPLIEENKKWKDKLPGFTCDCGHSGKGHELLVDRAKVVDDTIMWCPVCKTAGWKWN